MYMQNAWEGNRICKDEHIYTLTKTQYRELREFMIITLQIRQSRCYETKKMSLKYLLNRNLAQNL